MVQVKQDETATVVTRIENLFEILEQCNE
jgi:dynein heavy chain